VDRFSKFFHKVIRTKILYVYTTYHLQYVATLPCEIRKCKNSTEFLRLNVTITICLKFNARSYVTCHKNIALMILLKYVYNLYEI